MTIETAKRITVDWHDIAGQVEASFGELLSGGAKATVASRAEELLAALGEWDEEEDTITTDERTLRVVVRKVGLVYKAGVDDARDAMMRAIREM